MRREQIAYRIEHGFEEKCISTEGQAGFRKKRSTRDNIYILNYTIEKELRKAKGKIYAFFVDLKAAFDRINRRKLIENGE
jgi:Reverse transcriptase (RNA-dependent DNA polymerase)